MDQDEIDRLMLYKEYIKKAKIDLLKKYIDKMTNLIEVDEQLDAEIKKLKGEKKCID